MKTAPSLGQTASSAPNVGWTVIVPHPVRILLVDDHAVVREALALLLSVQHHMRVVAQAANGREAIEQFREYEPDLVLMDVWMPEVDGVKATQLLCREFVRANIIMLTMSDREEDIYQAFHAGAKAYLHKSQDSAELIRTIQNVMIGQIDIPPSLACRLEQRLARRPLTPREMEILQCLARGMSNPEIAAECFITEGTVRTHVNNLLNKLQVNDRASALIVALQRGLVRLD